MDPPQMSSSLPEACRANDLNQVRRLLADPLVDPAAENNCALKWACEYNHADILKLLLNDPRVDPAADHNCAIITASSKGHADVVALLMDDPRINPAATDNYAFHSASANGNTDVVKLFLNDPRVNPASNDYYAVKIAAYYKHTDVVVLILSDPRADPQYMLKKLQSENCCKKILDYVQSIANIRHGILEACSFFPYVVRSDLGYSEEYLRSKNDASEQESIEKIELAFEYIKALSPELLDVLIYRAKFSSSIMLSLLKIKYSDLFKSSEKAEEIFQKLVEKKLPVETILKSFDIFNRLYFSSTLLTTLPKDLVIEIICVMEQL